MSRKLSLVLAHQRLPRESYKYIPNLSQWYFLDPCAVTYALFCYKFEKWKLGIKPCLAHLETLSQWEVKLIRVDKA